MSTGTPARRRATKKKLPGKKKSLAKRKPAVGGIANVKKAGSKKRSASTKTVATKKGRTPQAKRLRPQDKGAPSLFIERAGPITLALIKTVGGEIIPEFGELIIDDPQDHSPIGTAVVLSFVHHGLGRNAKHTEMTRLHVSRQAAAKIGQIARKKT